MAYSYMVIIDGCGGSLMKIRIVLIIISILLLESVFLFSMHLSQYNHSSDLKLGQQAKTNPPSKSVLSRVKSGIKSYQPIGMESGSYADYNIDIELNDERTFLVHAQIKVKNHSEYSWSNLVFYFIPNIFTEKSKIIPIKEYATVKIIYIKNADTHAEYSLEGDRLSVQLSELLKPKEQATIKVKYKFTLPRGRVRFTEIDNNYYLAQWYPMLATFQKGSWNKAPYTSVGESYHTMFSSFSVSYDIKEGYQVFSTASNDPITSTKEGKLKVDHVKEFYLAIINQPNIRISKVKDIQVRVIGNETIMLDYILGKAVQAVSYFEENIGPYPHKQLDVLVAEKGMEYPGIVTVLPNTESISRSVLDRIIVHEIAHQWFYGVVTNDPYYEGWLDEGLTELAASLYFYDFEKKGELIFERERQRIKQVRDELQVANLTPEQYDEEYWAIHLYSLPQVKMWDLFQKKGGLQVGLQFLSSYYEQYSYRQISTKEFIRFTKAYFNLADDTFFKDWLEI